MERGGSRRGNAPPESDGKVRDFNNWERRGPLSPIPAADGMRNAGRAGPEAPRERRNSPSWGEHGSQEGSRPPKGEFRDRPQYERQPTAAEMDNEWRSKMRPDAAVKSKSPTPSPSIPSSPAMAAPPLAVRPKLNLAKRTVSEAEPAPAPSSDSKASPFGGARPIDTATRERQVEEKRQQAVQKKKQEMEDKAKEEKERLAREAAAKAEKSVEKDAEEGSQNDDEDKANGADASERSHEVPTKLNDQDDDEDEKTDKAPEDGRREARANGSSERGGRSRGGGGRDGGRDGREPPRGPRFNAGGSWRGGGRKPSNASNPTSPATAAAADEDGWSTVPPASQKRGQRSRGGHQSTRAAAS
jgi:translation initiation factor 4B